MAPPRFVSTKEAPQAVGPYSQGVVAGNLLFISGQLPMDPETGEIVGQDIAQRTRRVLENIRAVARAAGADLCQVVKTTVYLTDLNDFAQVNRVYADVFGDHKPARATVEVARLPKDVLVEIECIAVTEA